LSISWIAAHRRSSELATAFGLTSHFVRGTSDVLPFRYVQQWRSTREILLREKPEAVMVMQPPPFALYAAAWYCRRTGATLVGDLHTGAFIDPKWRWSVRSVMALLKRYGFAVVPNAELATWCREAGVDAYVCAAMIRPAATDTSRLDVTRVLVPLTYSFDEPVDEILQAAVATPHLRWTLTGKAPDTVKRAAPSNVEFSGFVSSEEYLRLRDEAALMVALTTAESTMQSVGFEALAAGKPLVTSPTRVLVDYFGESARYADANAASIAKKVDEAIRDAERLASGMAALRSAKIVAQEADFAAVLNALAERSPTVHG
jgi:glycosyltransferase involved in cell wall biosynthesis